MWTNKYIALVLACFLFAGAKAQVNDHIFPAAPAARPYIDFDKKGFLIHGRRTFIVSAGIEYARVPHQLWSDRLLRLRRAGFNCVEIYTFWNWHEPHEGQFDFKGDHDLDAFLKLVHRMDMYAIVRVGPYYCAEWDNGGYPLWLRFKPGVRVREPNAPFEKYAGRFFDRLIPIVAANQVNHGGSVILVQLENEHNLGWGTAMPNTYFTFLKDKAVSLGIQVPYFFSGLHHDSDPAGDRPSLDDPTRPNPWMSTEFWCVWYNGYGSTEKDARTYAYRTWKIIARGGNGYNYYMAHGGSNFGYTNNDEDAASYDYGAAVGQGGDLRPVYYAMKRAALFARSFQDILENSTAGAGGYRVSPAGRIRFADTLPPTVEAYTLNPGIRLDSCEGRILTLVHQGKEVTIVTYGDPGSRIRLDFSLPQGPLRIDTTVSTEPFTCGFPGVRVLVMNGDWADRTWVVGHDLVVGPRYVGRMTADSLETEDTLGAPVAPVWVYTEGAVRAWKAGAPTATPAVAHITPGPWEGADARSPLKTAPMSKASAVAAAQMASAPAPEQMGSDGDLTADAWYSTKVFAPSAGPYTLLVQGADRATAFLDGKPIDSFNIKDGQIPLVLGKGPHDLEIFTAHDGRDKLAGFLGPIDKADRKGLFGQALLVKGPPPFHELQGWRMVKATDMKQGPPKDMGEPYTIGQDAFDKKQGFGWFQVDLPDPAAPTIRLDFASVDENATVFINGRRVYRHEGWNEPFSVTIDHADTLARPVRLSVFVENYSNEGGIDKPVREGALSAPVLVTGWRMQGGTGLRPQWRPKARPAARATTRPTAQATAVPGTPCWWRTTFDASPDPALVWRIIPKGLGHGSIWVNGHHLGRYPEKIPVEGLFVPSCWLRNTQNELVVFDEDGRDARQVTIGLEAAASRNRILWQKP
ncbi:beta-galactosidase [Dinghuibacter silviterrae]|uniref:beta-galactosidase n=1 Tax=Dinghuibacter silviterrae TaxID=1539049 RepID=UPI0013C33B06|nr:beta-galactosidase [Dinghuibacter silviterrae]